MENERKDYKEKTNYGKQVFYFNDKGQLVVETNKGVWVDGEKFVKMYGDFTCNAKTMGAIISKLKGIPVKIGDEQNWIHHSKWYHSCEEQQAFCIIGLKEEEIKEAFDCAFEQKEGYKKAYSSLHERVENFNRLPWWKRIFKKIEVK